MGQENTNETINAIVNEMPTPQEHAIEAERLDEEQAQAEHAGVVDKAGNPFDPSIHATDSTGSPVLNVDGTVRKKRGARTRSAGGSRSSLHIPGQGQASDSPGAPAQGSPELAGKMIAENIFMLGQAIGGEEWAPFETWNPQAAKEYGINERAAQYQAWTAYCEAKGISDIPPGVMVLLVMGQYAGIRLAMPKTKSRLARAKTWIATKYAQWKTRGKPNARSNRGNDAERED